MIRLLYISQASTCATDEQIQVILKKSRHNNEALDITGLLIYGGLTFAQVLEGPEANVLRLYVKIMDDSSHHGCKLVHITPTKVRLFEHWFMGIIDATPLELQHLDQIRVRRNETVPSEAFTNLMKQFLGKLKAK